MPMIRQRFQYATYCPKERSAFTVSLLQVGDSNCTECLESSVELLPIVHNLALILLPVLERLSVFSVMTQVVLIISAPHGAWGSDFMTLKLKNFSSSVCLATMMSGLLYSFIVSFLLLSSEVLMSGRVAFNILLLVADISVKL